MRLGVDPADPNRRQDPCGCIWWFCAPPVNNWVRFDICEAHAAGRDDIANGEVWPDDPDEAEPDPYLQHLARLGRWS